MDKGITALFVAGYLTIALQGDLGNLSIQVYLSVRLLDTEHKLATYGIVL